MTLLISKKPDIMKTKTTFILFAALLFSNLMIIQFGCRKYEEEKELYPPTVVTDNISNITQTTASCGGNVTDDDESAVTSRGVCWSIFQNPLFSDNYTIDGHGTGTYISEITGLTPNTTYYVRAYAINKEGYACGKQKKFTTQSGVGDCPATFTYQGQVYKTVLIGNQCLMAENLNVGTMINGSENMSNNEVIEKYCYDNDTANCNEYGALYQWNEMMQYVNDTTTQGICPFGWHIPTDTDWKILEGTVDTHYPVGDPEWEGTGGEGTTGYRGFNAGSNLKSTSGWYYGGNGIDHFGFTALPGDYRNTYGNFDSLAFTSHGYFWSSSEYSNSYAWYRLLLCSTKKVYRYNRDKANGYSVRCSKDY